MPDETVTAGKNTPRVRSPHHRVVYANQINTTSGETEVRIRFGITALSDDGVLTIEDQVDVIIAPSLAFKMGKLLHEIVKRNYPALEGLLDAKAETK